MCTSMRAVQKVFRLVVFVRYKRAPRDVTPWQRVLACLDLLALGILALAFLILMWTPIKKGSVCVVAFKIADIPEQRVCVKVCQNIGKPALKHTIRFKRLSERIPWTVLKFLNQNYFVMQSYNSNFTADPRQSNYFPQRFHFQQYYVPQSTSAVPFLQITFPERKN